MKKETDKGNKRITKAFEAKAKEKKQIDYANQICRPDVEIILKKDTYMQIINQAAYVLFERVTVPTRYENLKKTFLWAINPMEKQLSEDVVVNGEWFMEIRHLVNVVRNQSVVLVMGRDSVQIGQGLPRIDWDLEQLWTQLETIHKENVDAGLTVHIDVLRDEHTAQEASKEKVEGKEGDTPVLSIVKKD